MSAGAAGGRGAYARPARAASSILAAALATGLVTTPASRAQSRPSEAELFGASPAAPDGGARPAPSTPTGRASSAPGADPGTLTPAQSATATIPRPAALSAGAQPDPPSAANAGGPPSRDDLVLGDPQAGPRLSEETAPEDPLKIGGQLYLRTLSRSTQGQALDQMSFSAPSLVDAYFDARPNDRVRGFVLGRMHFDSTLPTTGGSGAAAMSAQADTTENATGGFSVPLLSGLQSTRGPNAILDQLWLRFDINRSVFITAGRQHVKWGTGRFWTPTDFLHPQRRNPVAAFDARPGFTMLKVHVPWEARGWNFYGFALVEGTREINPRTGRFAAADGGDAANTLGRLGAAARAEIVLGTAELGLDVVGYKGQKARFGGDLSFGIGEFDLYVDAGFRFGEDLARRSYDPNAPVPVFTPEMPFTTARFNEWIDAAWPVETGWSGIKPQVALGGTYSLKYNDNDVFTLTGEYFYNSRGYSDPRVYPGLFFSNTFDFFYTGRHYAAVGAILVAPWSWNYTTFSLTTLGNLSDQSFLTTLNYSLVLLTHLRFEAFGAVNSGRREGEFRLGVSEFTVPGGEPFRLEPQSFSLGLGLRISI